MISFQLYICHELSQITCSLGKAERARSRLGDKIGVDSGLNTTRFFAISYDQAVNSWHLYEDKRNANQAF